MITIIIFFYVEHFDEYIYVFFVLEHSLILQHIGMETSSQIGSSKDSPKNHWICWGFFLQKKKHKKNL